MCMINHLNKMLRVADFRMNCHFSKTKKRKRKAMAGGKHGSPYKLATQVIVSLLDD